MSHKDRMSEGNNLQPSQSSRLKNNLETERHTALFPMQPEHLAPLQAEGGTPPPHILPNALSHLEVFTEHPCWQRRSSLTSREHKPTKHTEIKVKNYLFQSEQTRENQKPGTGSGPGPN